MVWQKKWEGIVDKALDDYNSLSFDERICYSIRILVDSVNNGGLISFYYNSGADYIDQTIEDLKHIDENYIVVLLEKMNSLFPNSKPPQDVDGRNEVISNWDDDDDERDKLLKMLDDKFYQLEDRLEEKFERIISNL